jgi:hypothetical protein
MSTTEPIVNMNLTVIEGLEISVRLVIRHYAGGVAPSKQVSAPGPPRSFCAAD